MFRKLELFLSSGEGETPTVLDPLQRPHSLQDNPCEVNILCKISNQQTKDIETNANAGSSTTLTALIIGFCILLRVIFNLLNYSINLS
jgi:hypothetical protein